MIRNATWVLFGVLVLFIGTLICLADTGRCAALFARVARVPEGDKIAHFFLFGSLALLANTALNGARIRLGAYSFLKGSTLVLIPTVLEEFSQIFIRSRTFDLLDLLADGVGVFLGGCIALLLIRRLNAGPSRVGAPVA